MGKIITLTTDFGLNDGYIAAMKGVILGINPEARLVDICHTVPPRDIAEGAFVLGTAGDFFPPDTVHLVVIDPGVGTERPAVILKTPGASFVAPDNGVLSQVIRRYVPGTTDGDRWIFHPSEGVMIISIEEERFWRSPVSPTFHGRDIFAPVAAHLSLGVPPEEFGPEVTELAVFLENLPRKTSDDAILGTVIHVDSFGNLITNITAADLPDDAANIAIEIGSETINGLKRTYGEGDGLIGLIGSSGYLEIAWKNGSAAAHLKAGRGDTFTISRA